MRYSVTPYHGGLIDTYACHSVLGDQGLSLDQWNDIVRACLLLWFVAWVCVMLNFWLFVLFRVMCWSGLRD